MAVRKKKPVPAPFRQKKNLTLNHPVRNQHVAELRVIQQPNNSSSFIELKDSLRVHRSQPLDPMTSQLNSVHILIFHLR
jgi:hypothetical protein